MTALVLRMLGKGGLEDSIVHNVGHYSTRRLGYHVGGAATG